MRRLRVRRPFEFAGSAAGLNLILDGNECGKIECGESIELPISNDDHYIHVRLWGEHYPDAHIPAGNGDCIATVHAPGFFSHNYSPWRSKPCRGSAAPAMWMCIPR